MHRPNVLLAVQFVNDPAIDQPRVGFLGPEDSVGMKSLGGVAGLQRRVPIGTKILHARFGQTTTPGNDEILALGMKRRGEGRWCLLVVADDPQGARMPFVGVHPHRGFEVAVLLAELAAGAERVHLNHVRSHLQADTRDAEFSNLDDGEQFTRAGEAPLGLVDLVTVEVIGESEDLAGRGVRGESRRAD